MTRFDLDDPRIEAHLRVAAGCVGLALCLAGIVLGLAMVVGEDAEALVRVAGATLLGASVALVVLLLRWARRSSWRYGGSVNGVSAGELFLIGFGTVVAFAVLSEPLGRWALLVFPLATAALIRLHFRRARPRR